MSKIKRFPVLTSVFIILKSYPYYEKVTFIYELFLISNKREE